MMEAVVEGIVKVYVLHGVMYTPKPERCPEVALTKWASVPLQIKIRACDS
jgi:hypothetical protein